MIIYEGPSELTGDPIVAIATSGSKNRKTGDMIQVWILSQDMDPLTANRTGADRAICGSCPLKGKTTDKSTGTASERVCYVLLQNAPLAVWRKYKAGGYERARSLVKFGAGKKIRLGAYGDPAALPIQVVDQLLKHAITWTGYTHQIADLDYERAEFFKSKIMVSCETVDQARNVWASGGRSFRMINSIDQLDPNEIICPATPEGGGRAQCDTCGLCKGSTLTARSIAVLAHGNGAKHSLNVLQ